MLNRNLCQSGKLQIRNKHIIRLIMVVLLIFALSGCKLIAEYDEIIDKTVTSLHTKINTFLVKMERCAGTPEGEYVKNTSFYDNTKGTMQSLTTRAAIISKNDIIIEQVNLLSDSIEKLRGIHERQGKGGLTKELIDPIKLAIDAQFASIIKLVNNLKRGKK